MTACSAYGCTNRPSKKIPGISFHSFPADEPRRSTWITAVRRKDWFPSKCSKLCSSHFNEDVIDRSMRNIVLKPSAVPTIFTAFPDYLQKTVNKRKTLNSSCDLTLAQTEACNSVHEVTKNELPTSGSPSKSTYKRALEETEQKLEKSRKKIKLLHQSKRRHKRKICNLKNIIKALKDERYLNDDIMNIIEASAGSNKELFTRLISKEQKKYHPKKYSPELRSFALTLHFYSPKAYRFVRKSFNSCLPHPRSLTKWYQHIDGTPGFTAESFITIRDKIKESKHELLFCLTFDEMAIRQHVEFDGSSFHGYVNVGVDINDDVLPVAKSSLVFLLVCINDSWKIPVGYFLIDSITALQKCNLVKQCLKLLHAVKAKVTCITFDGLPANITMASNLGCCMEPRNLNTVFPHPNTQEDIAVLLDPSHMLKLVRNTLGEKKYLIDLDGKPVEWKYVAELQNLQETEGLHLANKLRSSHINFYKRKMKVSLAAQVLSKSVSDAIQFCNSVLHLPKFQGSEGTVKFVEIFNNLFDILNSHNQHQYNWKRAINKKNYDIVKEELLEMEKYIRGLKTASGQAVLSSARKTGFLGFLVCIKSTMHLVEQFILRNPAVIHYLPTYKLSQDHVELLFAKIRLLGSCNNNPTARQFVSAYKKLLVKSQLADTSAGNCIPLTSVSILHYSHPRRKKSKAEEIINMTTKINEENSSNDEVDFEQPPEHDYMFSPSALSICSEHVVYYIAGFVSRKLAAKLKCQLCSSSLFAEFIKSPSLICYKSKGYLVYPSEDVFTICKISESTFRKYINLSGGNNLKPNFSFLKITSEVLKSLLHQNLFLSLTSHIFDAEAMDNHYIHLLRAVIEHYLNIRFKYFTKSIVDSSGSNRQLYTKLILFGGQ